MHAGAMSVIIAILLSFICLMTGYEINAFHKLSYLIQ